jgi:tetratricopeptide (TPR) repeat protein
VWQDLHAQLEPAGLTVVTVALDLEPDRARPWIEAAAPTHPSLIDREHRVDELFGICNVPMAVWIDESGTLVRPAESARLEPNEYAAVEISDEMPEQMRRVIEGLQQSPDFGPAYRAAIVDWVERGADSPFAMSPDEVIEASQPRPPEHSRAAACFELGIALHEAGDTDGAVRRWKQAHELYPDNWTYKRQAWTLASTPEGADSDMAQEVHDVYGTSWSEEFLAAGGGATYGIVPRL